MERRAHPPSRSARAAGPVLAALSLFPLLGIAGCASTGRGALRGDLYAETSVASFLAGVWRQERASAAGTSIVEEIWSEPLAGGSLGSFRWIAADGRVIVHELLSIQEEPEGVFLRLRHFDGRMHAWEPIDQPLTLRLAEQGPTRLVFTAHEHAGELQSMVYNSTHTDDLAIEVHFTPASGRQPLHFALRRTILSGTFPAEAAGRRSLRDRAEPSVGVVRGVN